MVQGRPRIQKQMSLWYERYRLPPNAERKYQYSIFDRVLAERSTASLEEAAIMTRAMPRLDMLVLLPDEIQIIEIKPDAQLKDVGQILQYERYLRRDIFLEKHLTRPIRRIMLTLNENGSVRAACEAEGIDYIVVPVLELPPVPE